MSFHYFDFNTVLIARFHDSYLNHRGKTKIDRGLEPGPSEFKVLASRVNPLHVLFVPLSRFM